jgi:glucose-1-phosphate thymidylyltransferase
MGVSKQLLPVYDKPMIYYPLSVLMLANIRDILIITTEEDQSSFQRLLGDGSSIGVNLKYEIQQHPQGLPQAFIIADDFIGNDNVCLVLGDNIFYGATFSPKLLSAVKSIESQNGAIIFGYEVHDPERYGVIEFNHANEVITIEEKPENPKSNFAQTGLFFYDNTVIKKARSLKPSARGEVEITALNKLYLEENSLRVELLGRGFAWLDTGIHDSLLEASNFVHTVEKRQGFKIACLEEIAFNRGWINLEELSKAISMYSKNNYGKYLERLIK